MWEFKSFQTKWPVFKRKLAEDGRALFSNSYVNTLRGRNSSARQAQFAQIMIKNKLIMALNDSGSSVNLLSDTLYQQLGEPSQIRVCNKNKIAANIGKMPLKGSTVI